MPASSHVLDPVRVTFDDDRAVADAGLLLTGTLVGRLGGLERTIVGTPVGVSRGYRPGRKLPGDRPMFIDVDSTICEVYGQDKQGAAYGYTRVLGYHPLLATRADTGEVLHARMRKGSANTARARSGSYVRPSAASDARARPGS
jgi:hypothetical protein